MQTRRHSAFEAAAYLVVGYLVGLVALVVIFPLVGVQVSFGRTLIISVLLALVDLARGHLMSRWSSRLAAAALAGAAREEAMIAGRAVRAVEAEPVCDVCGTPLEPGISDKGIWRCECIFEPGRWSDKPMLVIRDNQPATVRREAMTNPNDVGRSA
jgi:hypothetical protein